MKELINKLRDELRNSRSDISQLLDNAWEVGGNAVGEEEFESYSWVKSARQQLDAIDEVLKLQSDAVGGEDLSMVSRVEVIDENGRSYTNYSVKEAKVQMQDDNRTMKIFITSKNPDERRKRMTNADADIIDFADWIPTVAQPRFPNKGEWYLLSNPDRSIHAIKTTSELLTKFSNR